MVVVCLLEDFVENRIQRKKFTSDLMITKHYFFLKNSLLYKLLKMNKNIVNYRKKGTNVNKPLKRERERELREERADKNSEKPHSSNRRPEKNDNWDRPPPGLKAKALGLWYRDRNRNRELKPMSLTLDRSKLDEIEDILLCAGTTHTQSTGHDNIREGTFRQNFLNKINVTFEEKLSQVEHVKLERDEELDEELFSELNKKRHHNDRFKEMFEFRQTLPSYSKRNEIIDIIKNNQVTVISGETGCGKTTQIVQFILDDYILNHKGSLYNAVCTQPRRISAISVAERVAAERAEQIGESIGFIIRLESEIPKRKRGSITFVTTGILVQILQSNPALDGITHLFIDEIHERNTICDFLITLLKSILPKRPDLKVILMSATLNAEHFSHYFGGAPCLEIPGFTYPVEELYLEDILQKVNYAFHEPPKQNYHRKIKNFDPIFNNYVLPYVNNLEKSLMYPKHVISALKNPESEKLKIDFIGAIVTHICTHEPEGAILVFVPGLVQIQDLHRYLTNNKFLSPSRFLIIPMHSILPTVNQRKAFERPPRGVRKIVISTSIAETSVTIDDVVYVVDCGKSKTMNFDLKQNVSILEPEWETMANARQRKGRAGRTQPGKCYKLFTKAREETFEPYPLPEMQRSRLEEVILDAKFLQLGKVKPFLESVMDPPDSEAVQLSLKMLTTLNVLDSDERLTPLGYHLAKLPLDPQTGKMILMGALFSCLDPILSIAACLNFKDPFIFVLGKEHLVDKKRLMFSRGEKSDHFMLSEAVRMWEEAEENGNGYNFSHENFLSNHNLKFISYMKKQFAKHLKNMNFVVSDDPKHFKSNINSLNVPLIKAIVCAGLYPNVATIKRIVKKKSDKSHKRVFWKTIDHHRVELHLKSVVEKERNFESPFLVYFEKVKSSSIFIYDATMVYPMALLFFGEKLDFIEDGPGSFYVRVDDMIKFSSFKKTGMLVKKLREQLLWILESAISNPEAIDWEKEDKNILILRAIVKLITWEDKTVFDDYVECDME